MALFIHCHSYKDQIYANTLLQVIKGQPAAYRITPISLESYVKKLQEFEKEISDPASIPLPPEDPFEEILEELITDISNPSS